jgi:hypothetical protein
VRDHAVAELSASQAVPSRSGGATGWAVAALGAGGVALGVASYLWISGLGDHSTLVSGCGQGHDCNPSDVDSAHRKLVAGDIVGGAGIALGALGVGILVLGRSSAPQTMAVVLHPVAGGALLGVDGRL